MSTSKRILWLSLLAAAPFAASTGWAMMSPSLPPAKSVGPVTYVTGGSDPAQAKAMRKEAASYPLELDFFWGRGQKETALNDVEWSIRNAVGHELVDSKSSGPEVLASLPNGRYTVTAHYDETTLSRTVSVHKGAHDTVVMEWPS